MKIAYVVQQFPPEIGAGPARVTEMAQRWQLEGAGITIVTAMPSRMLPRQRAGTRDSRYDQRFFMRESWNDMDVLRSWAYTSPQPGFLRTVVNNISFMLSSTAYGLLKLARHDVLIASSPPFLPHIAGWLLAAAKRTPLVLELRDLWPEYLVSMGVLRRNSPAARMLFALERALLRSATGIVVVTESFAEHLVALGVDRKRISVIPNGVDLAQYTADESAQPAVPADSFTIGYLGNFGAGQDLSVLVRAAALLEEEGVQLVLVGDGPDRLRLESFVRSSGVRNVVLRDPIPKHETLACYHSFDVCLVPLAPVPAFANTIPSKIFEIMACERPLLASVAGETKRIVEESGCGVVVAPGDHEAIANGVRQLRAMSAESRRQMGQKGRAYVSKHYSRDELAKQYYRLLQAVVAQSSQMAADTRNK